MAEHRKIEKQSIMNRQYDPKEVESHWYEFWESEGYFKPKGEGERFSIVIPPPNVTGNLHVGHALNLGLHDVVVRFKRMLGLDTLWIPGVDHAGIATQTVVERRLLAHGKRREDMGREKFLEEVWKWKDEAYNNITNQMRMMGFSVDWDRERFTLDPGLANAVREVFVRLYQKGWIYRGTYMVNWCPICKTVLSDLEVEHKDIQGNLWDITYPLEDGDGRRGITVSTTRPETMLADTAVAVNPNDERYRDMIGKNVILPLMNKPIPVIADEYVDMTFGTGALKITPAHDPNDYEIGQRHKLDAPVAIGKDGTITDIHEKYKGMDRYKARKAILNDLKNLGLLGKIEPYSHAVGHHDRCGNEIEPYISTQWFVKMDEYVKPAMDIVRDGRLEFISDRWSKVYLDWLENIRDWCISRQLWWGHRIPAFYCNTCNEVMVTRKDPTECTECGSKDIRQDEDVLDTWFSSALWPFSVMGWPENTDDLRKYYPTDLLITGYDIIFFWVARMAWSAMEFMGDVPFHQCFIHGLVRDEHGKKMSKSAGNALDPLETIEEFGRDTLRFTLVSLTYRGKQDISLGKDKLQSSRYFMNKIWNASKFVMMNLEEPFPQENLDKIEAEIKGLKKGGQLSLTDRYILDKFYSTVHKANSELDRYNFGEYASTMYSFFWDEFCDWYIECCKTPLRLGGAHKRHARLILQMILMKCLQMLHPSMPYITEEIWHEFPGDYRPLIVNDFPKFIDRFIDSEARERFERIKSIVSAIRSLRKDLGIKDSAECRVAIKASNDDLHTMVIEQQTMIRDLTRLQSLEMIPADEPEPSDSISMELDDKTMVYLLIDDPSLIQNELNRLEKEAQKIEQFIGSINKKLSNKGFMDKAPESVIEQERGKLSKSEGELKIVMDRIEKMKRLIK